MTKQELLQMTGTLQQVAYTRACTVQEGRANGLRTVEVKNGPMRYLVLADKGLDIGMLEYRGINLSFTAKPGINGRNAYDTNGQEALRSIVGGLFFTCGLENICAPCQTNGKDYPMHGRLRTTPAEHVCSDAAWEGENYLLSVSGELREAELFGENLTLRRRIVSRLDSRRIELCDTVENLTGRKETMMLMYHCNFGYPLLQPGTRLILPTKKVAPRDAWSGGHLDRWAVMDPPAEGENEYVFLHDLAADETGRTFSAIVNDKLGLGVRIDFNRCVMPYFMEWKSIAAGDYVIGLEPSNSSVYGRKYHEVEGTLATIGPYQTMENHWSFTVLDGADELEETERACRLLIENQ
jgi:hypothetical protein